MKKSMIKLLALMLSLVMMMSFSVVANAEELSSPEEPVDIEETVYYPLYNGVASGSSISTITLYYYFPTAGVYTISYAYWVDGTYSNGKMTFTHDNTGASAVATLFNRPNGDSTIISLPYSGYYTVTLSKYNSGSARFYYSFDIIK